MDNKDRKDYWIHCPICKAKTRTKVQQDTVLLNFPLFCPRCKKTIRIGVINLKLVVPDEAED